MAGTRELVKTFTTNIFGGEFVITVHKCRDWDVGRKVKGRAYVFGEPSPDTYRDDIPRSPPYSTKGDDPEIDKEWVRYNRAEVETIRQAAAAVFKEIGVETGMKFSKRAGCSMCPCSPGLILTDIPATIEYFISIATPEKYAAEQAEKLRQESFIVHEDIAKEFKTLTSDAQSEAKYAGYDVPSNPASAVKHLDEAIAKLMAAKELISKEADLQRASDAAVAEAEGHTQAGAEA
jgi:hypothetical protein